MNEKEIKTQIIESFSKLTESKTKNPKNRYWVVMHISVQDNYYLQASTLEDPNTLSIELSAIHNDSVRLSKEKLDIIDRYKYKWPNRWSPNFHKEVKFEQGNMEAICTELYELADKIFDLNSNLPLKIEYNHEVESKKSFLSKFFKKIFDK
jgi:hypothetical protein